MLHVVEVHHIGHDLERSMAELRCWLDRHDIHPAEFEHSVGGPGITYRVHFAAEPDATAFATKFHGWLDKGVEPRGAARWRIEPSS